MRFTLFVLVLLLEFVAASAFAQGSDTFNPLGEAAGQASDAADQAGQAADQAGQAADQAGDAADKIGDTMGGQSDSGMSSEIEATVSSIDQDKGELKVNDLSGVERTYEVQDTQALQDLKEGDKVKITPDSSDPTKAQSVEKQE